jgi:hypothetical protein
VSHAPAPLADPPSEVQITVIAPPRKRRADARLVMAVLVTVALASVMLTLLPSDHQASPSSARASAPGTAGVAAAYDYPRACLTVAIAAHDPAYARARLDRASPCWRIGAYGVAVFRRVRGSWRPVFVHSTYSCPVASLPAAVQSELDVCPRANVGVGASSP